MPISNINGIDIYHESYGDGFPLVFVHGGFGGLGTGQMEDIPQWVSLFAKEYKVILYDRRSSGRSAYPASSHSMSDLVGDLHGLLNHLGHDGAHIWGTSAGGPIALAYGIEHPNHTLSLIISDSAPYLSRDSSLLEALKRRIAILENRGDSAAYQDRREIGTVGLNLFADSPPNNSTKDTQTQQNKAKSQPSTGGADSIRAYLPTLSKEERVSKYAGELRNYGAYLDWDASGRLHELNMPVAVLYGTADAIFPDVDWEDICEKKSNFHYKPVDGAKHGQASGERVWDYILDFLDGSTSRG